VVQNLTGMKIRTLRIRAGLTQGALARRVGVSPSYLNLIELNKRAVAGVLLERIAAALGVERALIDGEAERRVVANLEEIAADPVVAEGAAHPGPAEELVGRNAGWADLLLRLYRAYLDQSQAVLALADRLNRDPFLGESVHRVLTNVTSIRSAAEILTMDERLDPEDRARFLGIIAADSERLSDTAQSLAAFFDSAHMRVRSATPMEHVDAFIFESDNHFAELEQVAAEFITTRRAGETLDAAAARVLGGEQRFAWGLPESQTAETRRFYLMRALAERIDREAVAALLGHPTLGSDDARALAAHALHAYAAAAILMPYEPFLEAAERCRYDLDILSRLFGVSHEQAAHRLATLRRPGAEGVRFAFMRSDPSGYVTKRLPLPRLPLPRYGNACPLWVVYGAFQTPGVTARAFGELPSGDHFLFFARTIEKRAPAANFPRHLLSVMLACPAADAPRVVYGDGIDRAGATVPLGTVCRLCPRSGCGQRQEAPLIVYDEKPMGRMPQAV
jgi:predicted transcriptional regulator/DNA-binding XRE family transcriptional regulator